MKRHISKHLNEQEPHICTICEEKFSRKDILIRHELTQHTNSEKPHVCSNENCGQKFRNKTNLNAHMSTHTSKKERCDKCSKMVKNLENHLKVSHPKEEFICSECTKKFSNESLRSLHMQSKHQTMKKLKCSDCNYQTSNASSLNEHRMIHTGKKDFKCPFENCKKEFNREKYLKKHIVIHTKDGDKPHQCRECNIGFSRKENFDDHMKKHTGEGFFKCPICSKKYTQKRSLNEHLRTKHSEAEIFKCPVCKELFSDGTNCSRCSMHNDSDAANTFNSK